ncbi:hypothetical protein [Stenotrophomonas sp. B1-1]|uniref:hypothetical protein n=1 Tax=Stenotrophomonas sp. B1-1 TaxID=2710648 RepID=UPI0013DC9C9B|nr:hypothetical protein [Stenotrophomonas sp. B1-1]
MDEVKKLEQARKSLPHVLNDTAPLERDDYFKIGLFIQTYCFADLEARRIINLLEQIQSGKPASYALKLNDKDTIAHLKRHAAECVWNKDISEGLGNAAEILDMHRTIRHMFAHWSGRRIPAHDAYIFFTANFAGQKIPDGTPKFEEHEEANMQYALMPIPNLEQELEKLKGHVQYMTNIGRQLEAKVSDIAEQFREDRNQGKF